MAGLQAPISRGAPSGGVASTENVLIARGSRAKSTGIVVARIKSLLVLIPNSLFDPSPHEKLLNKTKPLKSSLASGAFEELESLELIIRLRL